MRSKVATHSELADVLGVQVVQSGQGGYTPVHLTCYSWEGNTNLVIGYIESLLDIIHKGFTSLFGQLTGGCCRDEVV